MLMRSITENYHLILPRLFSENESLHLFVAINFLITHDKLFVRRKRKLNSSHTTKILEQSRQRFATCLTRHKIIKSSNKANYINV